MRLVLGLPCLSTVLPSTHTMAHCLRADRLRMACGRASLRPASIVALTIPSLMHVQMPDALTFSQMLGLAIFRCPLSLLSALQPCGPFPQRALPRVCGTTDHSATLSDQPAPYGVPVAACHSTDRASRVATFLIFHACVSSANTPVSPLGALVARFPRRASLPHITERSTLTLPVSRMTVGTRVSSGPPHRSGRAR